MEHLKFLKSILYILICTTPFVSCRLATNKLEKALTAAGDNRYEIEKLLFHYENEPLKKVAALYLVENMVGHSRFQPEIEEWFQPFYDLHQSVSEKHNHDGSKLWQNEIDSLWKAKSGRFISQSIKRQPDIQNLKADWLISEIDLAFDAWKENAYSRDASFEVFCQYILPYRISNNLIVDDSRKVFYNRHKGYFSHPGYDFQELTDSLHAKYAFLKHNNFAAASMPIYSASVFEKIKRGSCEDKTWYNTLLMSALGMPVTTDFVPAWGNRNSGHVWNTLIVDGETYPFEPFWDEDRWKYKRIYNNIDIDYHWGKFRLPKVYRHTYEYHTDGPISNKQIDRKDIPALFHNIFMKDVSYEYFDTTNVTIPVTQLVEHKVSYCYLCVFQTHGFSPVAWGEINNQEKVTFKGIGKDIIYFPMFYKKGVFLPAASPFHLTPEGEVHPFTPNQTRETMNVRFVNSFMDPTEIREARDGIRGSYFVSGKENDVSKEEIMVHVSDSLDAWGNYTTLSYPTPCRYIRLKTPLDTFAVSNIFFYEKGNSKPISDIKVTASMRGIKEGETLSMIADGLSATGYKGIFTEKKRNNSHEILFDLGKKYDINAIDFAPYFDSALSSSADFELFYWADNQWISGGIQKGNDNFLSFPNIPQGTIYQLRRANWSNIRIFTYDNGHVKWH